MNFVTMMALGFPMQLIFEILGQPYFPFFLVFCEIFPVETQAQQSRGEEADHGSDRRDV